MGRGVIKEFIMEPRDGNGPGDGRPARKKRAPSARKRPPKAVRAAEENGATETERDIRLRTAYDVKDVHRALSGFSDDDLKQIPIVPEGTHLEQGATYIDLAEEPVTEVKVNAGVVTRAGQFYVPKNRVPYTIWNRLIGEAKPGQELSGVADRSAADADTFGERDANHAADVAADLKSWMDTRHEDRDGRGEVL
jgi:hypothetical protein